MKYKYDKREQRIFLACGIIFTGLFLLALIAVRLQDKAADINAFGIICVIAKMFTPIPAFASWYAYFDCTVYIKKLERGGVNVPEDKRFEPVMAAPPVYQGEEKDSKESLALAVICFAITAALLIYIVMFYIKWNARLGGEGVFMSAVQFIAVILWCIGGIVYFRQRSAATYRDDTVFDPGRKERTGLAKGILIIVIMLAVTAAALSVASSMTNYLYRTRMYEKYGENWRVHDGEAIRPGDVYR